MQQTSAKKQHMADATEQPLDVNEIKIASSLLMRAVRFHQAQLVLNEVEKMSANMNRPAVISGAQMLIVEATGSMSDGAKRRLDFPELASECDVFGSDKSSVWEEVEQLSGINVPKASSEGYPKAEESIQDLNHKIPLPSGCASVHEWKRTICEMEKVAKLNVSYEDMVNRAKSDSKDGEDMRRYMSWIKTKYGTNDGAKLPLKITPAVDLAMFLEKIKWKPTEESNQTFQRKFAA